MLLAVTTLLIACGGTAGGGACEVDQDAGTAVAVVDGEDWTGAGATWRWSGSSLQINTLSSGSWWLSLVAQTTTDGTAVADAVDAGSFPVEVSLVDGGWATFYPAEGDSYSSKAGDGTLEIASADDTSLLACFSFSAAQDGGDSVTVDDGTLDATAAR